MNEYEAKLRGVAKGNVVVYMDAASLERSFLQVTPKAKGPRQSPEPRS